MQQINKLVFTTNNLENKFDPIDSVCYEEYRIKYPKELKKLLINKAIIKTLEIYFMLDEINLSDVNLLIEFLKTDNGKKIKNLHIMSSRLNNIQAELIINCITDQVPYPIEGLSLWENDLTGDLSFLKVIKKLKNTLKYLTLAENNLTGNLEYIAEIVNSCLFLENLHLNSANISDLDLEKFCLQVKAHPNLNKISLHGNRKITNKSLNNLEFLLNNNTKIKHITLLGNGIDDYSSIEMLEKKYNVNIVAKIEKNKLNLVF